MELFERVAELSKLSEGGRSSLAEEIGINRHTFQGYFSKKRQDNLWPLLPKILDLFPQINKYWLYFEEGEMLGEAKSSPTEAELLRQQIKDREQRIQDLEKTISLQDKIILLVEQGSTFPLKKDAAAVTSGNAAHSLQKAIK